MRAAVAHIVERIGWRQGDATLALAEYTVRQGTEMQMAARRPARVVVAGQEVTPPTTAELLAAFAAEAGPGLQSEAVLAMMRRVWPLRWDNRRKEALWLLALNGLPVPARMHHFERPCGCGEAVGAGRAHVYADCRAARHVWDAVAAQLHGAWGLAGGPLERRHVCVSQGGAIEVASLRGIRGEI